MFEHYFSSGMPYQQAVEKPTLVILRVVKKLQAISRPIFSLILNDVKISTH